MMSTVFYIVEGEIEKRFIQALQQMSWIQIGRVLKFNLMQEILKDTNNILTRKIHKIYCIIDTDCAETSNIEKLCFNLKKLRSICQNNIFCLVQNKSFEDELKYLLDCNDLAKVFKLKYNSLKDIKTYLSQTVKYEGYITKENLVRYCSRSEDFTLLLNHQNKSQIKIITFEKCLI